MEIENTDLLDDEINQLKNIFQFFDNDNSGKISSSELKQALKYISEAQKHQYRLISKLINQLKIETTDKEINELQFIQLIQNQLGNRTTQKGIDKLFDLFCNSKTQTINFDQLKQIYIELGEDIPDQKIEQIIKIAASNGRDISRNDFYTYMVKKMM